MPPGVAIAGSTSLLIGISSAPGEFQRRLDDVPCGLEAVINIADDITVVAEALLHRDRGVLELLDRLLQPNLRLNSEKVKFKTGTAPFMGHVLTPEGLKPRA